MMMRVFSAALLTMGLALGAGPARAADPAPAKLGIGLGLTGPLAFLSQQYLRGLRAAVEVILLAKSFLAETPHPTDDEIRRALASNLCRCTGYVKMVEAVRAASPARS